MQGRCAPSRRETCPARASQVREPHRDIGCWWTLYDYGLDRVKLWARDYTHPYPGKRGGQSFMLHHTHTARVLGRLKCILPPNAAAHARVPDRPFAPPLLLLLLHHRGAQAAARCRGAPARQGGAAQGQGRGGGFGGCSRQARRTRHPHCVPVPWAGLPGSGHAQGGCMLVRGEGGGGSRNAGLPPRTQAHLSACDAHRRLRRRARHTFPPPPWHAKPAGQQGPARCACDAGDGQAGAGVRPAADLLGGPQGASG